MLSWAVDAPLVTVIDPATPWLMTLLCSSSCSWDLAVEGAVEMAG
jgi:hypothetical protein